MQLSIPKKQLVWLAQTCAPAADKKSAMPILAFIKLVASNNVLQATATDMYLTIQAECAAEVAQSGSVAVDARALLDRAKAMPDGPVTITVRDGDQVVISAKGSKRSFTQIGMPGKDFPEIDGAPDVRPVRVERAILGRMIGAVIAAVSLDETRSHVNSALFQSGDGSLLMVATDGHRLHKVEVRYPGIAPARMLIPLKALSELRRIVDSLICDEIEVRITSDGKVAHWQLDDLRLSTRLVDAAFPPYDRVIPQSFGSNIRVAKSELNSAVEAVEVASNKRAVTIGFETVDTMTLSACSPDAGDGHDEIAVEYNTRPKEAIGVNGRYLRDALAAIPTDLVQIGVTGELDPVMVRPGPDSPIEFVAVIMPMRI